MMKIYIIRHGETQWNKEEVFRGRKDISLNETGKKQVERVGLYFSNRPINRIVSSPLARARQTAEAISNPISIAIETMEELTDFNFGIWEGLPLREVEKRFPADFAIWKTSPEKLRIENGDTLAMVRNRISAGLANITRLRRKPWPPGRGGMRVSSEALAKEDWSFGGLRRTAGATGSCPWGSTSGQEGAVVIVTHRVICKIIVLHALGIGNEHFWDMKYDPGSITLLDRKNDKYTLIFSNDTCHLYNHAYLDF